LIELYTNLISENENFQLEKIKQVSLRLYNETKEHFFENIEDWIFIENIRNERFIQSF